MRAGKASVCQTNLKDSSRLNPPKVRWCQKIKHEGKQVSTKLSESGVQSHVITLFLCFHGEKGHCTCDLTNLRIPNTTNNKGMLLNEGVSISCWHRMRAHISVLLSGKNRETRSLSYILQRQKQRHRERNWAVLCKMGSSAATRLQIPDCIFISINDVEYLCFGFDDLTCASEAEERGDGFPVSR